ncbi:MAG: hypothetical protein V4678_01315 [Patescibacteria group bacterium]
MANIEPIDSTTQQPISDDQELAKVLAGVDMQADAAADAGAGTIVPPADAVVVAPEPLVAPEITVPPISPTLGSDDLNGVKQEALSELRPLVDKLNIPAEEKFDTYLLLLRSTDDKTLIEPAHETAKLIEDESRRAQALLDIIKEIDFLSAPKQ